VHFLPPNFERTLKCVVFYHVSPNYIIWDTTAAKKLVAFLFPSKKMTQETWRQPVHPELLGTCPPRRPCARIANSRGNPRGNPRAQWWPRASRGWTGRGAGTAGDASGGRSTAAGVGLAVSGHCFDRDLGKLKNCRVFFLERNIYFLNEKNLAD